MFLWGHGEKPNLKGESRFVLEPFAKHLTDVFTDPSLFAPKEMWIYSCYSNKLRLPAGGKFKIGYGTDTVVNSATIYNNLWPTMSNKITAYYEAEAKKCMAAPPANGGSTPGGRGGEP